MSKSSRLGEFLDVKEVLDAALAAGGGTYTLPSYGKAVYWTQRAHRFRKAFAASIGGISPYDRLVIRKVKPESCDVIIDVRSVEGIFQPKSAGLDSELEAEAAALIAKLNGDVI